jgi:hypothetical protein
MARLAPQTFSAPVDEDPPAAGVREEAIGVDAAANQFGLAAHDGPKFARRLPVAGNSHVIGRGGDVESGVINAELPAAERARFSVGASGDKIVCARQAGDEAEAAFHKSDVAVTDAGDRAGC